jgi:hypothetical protein
LIPHRRPILQALPEERGEPRTPGFTHRVVAFEYLDLGDRTPGNCHYLRVEQVDGAAAWSSPWWVGSPAGSGAS